MLIDEAHSTFLFGPNGRGVAEHFGLDKEVDFHLGTFSKSLGGQGGFVAGVEGAHRLRQRLRALALLLLQPVAGPHRGAPRRRCGSPPRSRELRAKLWSNVAFLRRRFAEEGVDIGKSNSQVMPVMVNNDVEGLRGGGEDPGPGPLPEPGDLSRRCRSTSRACGSRSPPPTPRRTSRRRCRRSPASCARRGFADNPLRLPRRDQRVLRVPDRQRAAHPPPRASSRSSRTTGRASSR